MHMGQQGRSGYPGNRGSSQRPRAEGLNPDRYLQDAVAIIDQGDARRLVELASQIGESGGATRTSVRRLYGEARRIDFLLDQDEKAALRRAKLLEPRLMYQVKRDRKLEPVVEALLALLRRATDDGASAGGAEKYRRFSEFFVAVVAYLPEK
jgi:CRISPR type III-A-associated protein Csm2